MNNHFDANSNRCSGGDKLIERSPDAHLHQGCLTVTLSSRSSLPLPLVLTWLLYSGSDALSYEKLDDSDTEPFWRCSHSAELDRLKNIKRVPGLRLYCYCGHIAGETYFDRSLRDSLGYSNTEPGWGRTCSENLFMNHPNELDLRGAYRADPCRTMLRQLQVSL